MQHFFLLLFVLCNMEMQLTATPMNSTGQGRLVVLAKGHLCVVCQQFQRTSPLGQFHLNFICSILLVCSRSYSDLGQKSLVCCLSTFSKDFSSETTRPISAKFHLQPAGKEGNKVYILVQIRCSK